jgi:hypothetical protein
MKFRMLRSSSTRPPAAIRLGTHESDLSGYVTDNSGSLKSFLKRGNNLGNSNLACSVSC